MNYGLEQLSLIPLVTALQTCNHDDRHPVCSDSEALDRLLSNNFIHTDGLHQVMLHSQTQTCPFKHIQIRESHFFSAVSKIKPLFAKQIYLIEGAVFKACTVSNKPHQCTFYVTVTVNKSLEICLSYFHEFVSLIL